jgi:hypothetical protein
MGVSTNAILAFGFNIADEDEMPDKLDAAGREYPDDDDSFFEFETVAAREAGIAIPDVE